MCLRRVEDDFFVGDAEGLKLVRALLGNVTVGACGCCRCEQTSRLEGSQAFLAKSAKHGLIVSV